QGAVDVGTADSMHPSVYITPSGTAGVAWESVVPPTGPSGPSSGYAATSSAGYCAGTTPATGASGGPRVGVYYSTKTWGGTWTQPSLVNSSAVGPSGAPCADHMMPNDAMMPGIALNDNDEIVVTYTFSPFGPTGELSPRRQFSNHFMIPTTTGH